MTLISSFRSSNISISYIHNFIFIFPGYITNQFNDQLPVGLLVQLVRALHRYRRGQGSNPGKPDFFRLSFRNCIGCVNNCEDFLYIEFLHSAVQIYEFHIFIISFVRMLLSLTGSYIHYTLWLPESCDNLNVMNKMGF